MESGEYKPERKSREYVFKQLFLDLSSIIDPEDNPRFLVLKARVSGSELEKIEAHKPITTTTYEFPGPYRIGDLTRAELRYLAQEEYLVLLHENTGSLNRQAIAIAYMKGAKLRHPYIKWKIFRSFWNAISSKQT